MITIYTYTESPQFFLQKFLSKWWRVEEYPEELYYLLILFLKHFPKTTGFGACRRKEGFRLI